MNKALTVTYTVEGTLYVNMTNRCTNSCDFCIRNNGDGAYGSDSLWLLREPTAEEVIREVISRLTDRDSELVFCGYGEPSIRLEDCRRVALAVKEMYPHISIRINTNGQSDLIYGCDTSGMYADAFDTVSVSLNAPTAEKYFEMCHPVYGKDTLASIITFVKNVKSCVHNTLFSVVKETLSEEELSACLAIAEECGVGLRVRDLITA